LRWLGQGEHDLLEVGAGGAEVREDLAELGLPPRDGDGDVVGEEVPEDECVEHGGHQQAGDGDGSDAREPDGERAGEDVGHHRGVRDRGDRRASHRERVRPPRQRETESPEEVDPHGLHQRSGSLLDRHNYIYYYINVAASFAAVHM
jgi:hypothetical protein